MHRAQTRNIMLNQEEQEIFFRSAIRLLYRSSLNLTARLDIYEKDWYEAARSFTSTAATAISIDSRSNRPHGYPVIRS
jgi:hypothetical protein